MIEMRNVEDNRNDNSELEVPPMSQHHFIYNHWRLWCVPLYFLWFPIFTCFFVGIPSVVVWGFLFYLCLSTIFQIINIFHALNENDKSLAIKMLLLQLLGILFAVWPIICNIDYSIRYMVQHNIFSSFP